MLLLVLELVVDDCGGDTTTLGLEEVVVDDDKLDDDKLDDWVLILVLVLIIVLILVLILVLVLVWGCVLTTGTFNDGGAVIILLVLLLLVVVVVVTVGTYTGVVVGLDTGVLLDTLLVLVIPTLLIELLIGTVLDDCCWDCDCVTVTVGILLSLLTVNEGNDCDVSDVVFYLFTSVTIILVACCCCSALFYVMTNFINSLFPFLNRRLLDCLIKLSVFFNAFKYTLSLSTLHVLLVLKKSENVPF